MSLRRPKNHSQRRRTGAYAVRTPRELSAGGVILTLVVQERPYERNDSRRWSPHLHMMHDWSRSLLILTSRSWMQYYLHYISRAVVLFTYSHKVLWITVQILGQRIVTIALIWAPGLFTDTRPSPTYLRWENRIEISTPLRTNS